MNKGDRSWIEIDLKKLKNNYDIFKENFANNKKIMCVIKADAYGHGDVMVAKYLQKNGVDNFAVSSIDEAINLRENDINGDILILGYTPISRINELVKYDLTQTLYSSDYASNFKSVSNKLKVNLAFDTGMRRIGFPSDDILKCESIIRDFSTKFNVTGIFTHLCVADSKKSEDISFTQKQIDLFDKICESVKDLKIKNLHCFNSYGSISYKSKYDNMVRLGVTLYGLRPSIDINIPDGIKQCMTWKSVVSMVKTVKCGDTIGYGNTYKCDKDMIIATIPTGYADGYSRDFSNKGYVLINNSKANIVGNICMDQMMVDVTDINDVHLETEVILSNEKLTFDMLAKISNTISYELVCNINKRVKKIYLDN